MDASVVLKWFLQEPDSAAADFLLDQFLNNEAELLAPDLMLVETASALWKRVMVRRELSSEEAASIYQDLLTLPLVLTPSGTVEAVALQIALQHNHSVYDSLYCALAIKRKCNSVTADRKLANKLSKTFPFIIHISAIQP